MPGLDYAQYLERLEAVGGPTGRGRKRLDEAAFERLHVEYERLMARMDPADIQLDEWKRYEELRFLLVLAGDDEDE